VKLTVDRRTILAHRGVWTRPEERNTLAALTAALEAGYGIETDLRDLDGALVVAHDPARRAVAIPADRLFEVCAARPDHGLLALNIKADGLRPMLDAMLTAHGIDRGRVFVFDMSVPDTLPFLSAAMPVYVRFSEYEDPAPLLDRAAGVWVDDFAGVTDPVAACQRFLAAGRRVALVSPELHGRAPEALWRRIQAACLHHDPGFALCTDIPDRARAIFGETVG